MTANASAQVTATDEQRVRGRPFDPGQSGNPGGRPCNGRRHRELLVAHIEERGGDAALSAVERVILEQAVAMLVRAERIKDANGAVRCMNTYSRLLMTLDANREAAKRKPREPSDMPTLGELLQRREATTP